MFASLTGMEIEADAILGHVYEVPDLIRSADVRRSMMEDAVFEAHDFGARWHGIMDHLLKAAIGSVLDAVSLALEAGELDAFIGDRESAQYLSLIHI